MKTRAIVCSGANQVELRQIEIGNPGPGELLLEALYSCISPGTEMRCLRGKQGDAKFPFIPGYAQVCRVKEHGPGCKLADGMLVFSMGTQRADGVCIAWGAHIGHSIRKESEVQVLPAGTDPIQASASKLASIPYHGLRMAKPLPEDRVAVIGLGVIGHMAAKLYELSGAHVVACDMSDNRIEAARKAGIKALKVKGTLKEAFAADFPEGADIVVDATGVLAVLAGAVEVARELPWGNHLTPGPCIVVQGSLEENIVLPYTPAFLREARILVPRSEQDRDREAIYAMIARKAISLKSVISDIRSPDAAQATYSDLMQKDTKLMTVVFDWKK